MSVANLSARSRAIHLLDQLDAAVAHGDPVAPIALNPLHEALARADFAPAARKALAWELRCFEYCLAHGATGVARIHLRRMDGLLGRAAAPASAAKAAGRDRAEND